MHYVYLHRRATDGEPFYVGKGKGKRARSRHNRSDWWRSVVDKHGYFVEIVVSDVQEWYACELECELIALYGRRDLGDGPLVNLTDGGDGAVRLAPETLKRIAEKNRGKRRTPEAIERASATHRGRKNTQETKSKMQKAALARRAVSDETRAKISESIRAHWEVRRQSPTLP